MTKVKAAIVGGTGYGGMELLRYLLDHPGVEVTAITSRTETGSVGNVHPHLRGLTDLVFTAEKAVDLAQSNDVLFFATPHGVAKAEVPEVLKASPSVKVIDLSQDWRRTALSPSGPWTDVAAYGLPECGRRPSITRPGCRLIANPGCHASAALLALYPLVRSARWEGRELATVVSVTGSSGSGATPSQGTHHPERFANFRAYKPLQHQHEEEIVLLLHGEGADEHAKIAFVPCSAPLSRGIANVVTVGLQATESSETSDPGLLQSLRKDFEQVYRDEPFVRLVPETAEVRAVAGTNFADIGVTLRHDVACVTVAIDNLGKGMAGTAVQNMNLLFGLEETAGLRRAGAGL